MTNPREKIRKYITPNWMTVGSLLNTPIKYPGNAWQIAVQHTINMMDINQALAKVPVILLNLLAPKFWPTIAAMADPTAMTGI
jgi:hypothetical protein